MLRQRSLILSYICKSGMAESYDVRVCWKVDHMQRRKRELRTKELVEKPGKDDD